MHQILVANDLSPRSGIALRRAVRLSAELGAALTIMHVIDDDLPSTIAEHQEAKAREILTSELAGLDAVGEVLVVYGAPAVEILRAADRLNPDLIVLGAHRPAFFADLVLGANIARIARHASHPVLLVSREPLNKYASVVAGIDFSAHAQLALFLATEIAPSAEICALHSFHIDFKGYQTRGGDEDIALKLAQPIEASAAREMETFLAEFDHTRITPKIVEDGPNSAIRQQIAAQNADLVALGAHGRSGLARAFIGSLAEEMLMDPPCDVLVARRR